LAGLFHRLLSSVYRCQALLNIVKILLYYFYQSIDYLSYTNGVNGANYFCAIYQSIVLKSLLSGKNLFPPYVALKINCIMLITNFLSLKGQAPLGAKY